MDNTDVSTSTYVIDFSDRLNRRKKAMYRTFVRRPNLESSEYEILPKEMILQETPVQKLRRLMYEVKELGQEAELNEQVHDFLSVLLCLEWQRREGNHMSRTKFWVNGLEILGNAISCVLTLTYLFAFFLFLSRFLSTQTQQCDKNNQPTIQRSTNTKTNTLARNRVGRRRDLTQGFAFACQVVGARLVRDWTDFGRRLQRRCSFERGIDQADGHRKAPPPAIAGYEALGCFFA